MSNTSKDGLLQPTDDVYCWVEHESTIMLKAVTKFGDPVELLAAEARALVAALLALVEKLEAD